MFTLKVENKSKQVLKLTQDESNYQVINIEGLEPPKSNIFTNPIANMQGEKFKSSKLEMRNIVFTIKVNGDAEQNRLNLYSYFGTGKWCKIYYKNGLRDVYIEGYCETIECPLFTMNQQMQISIICPDPYLKSVEMISVEISKLLGVFTFPFAIAEEGIPFSNFIPNRKTEIVNTGEADTGLIITLISPVDGVVNPTIYDTDTGEFMRIETTMNNGDEIIINTNKGQKSIVKIIDGEELNIINSLNGSSTWLSLDVGSNNFTYEADENDDKLFVTFEYYHQYEGA